MDINILKKIEEGQMKKRPNMRIGDTVKLHMRIKEGNKERVQIFEGVVIALKSSGINQTVTVRKISYGVGVERIVPVHSDLLQKIEIVKRGTVNKAKLFYLRDRVGRKALKVKKVKDTYLTDEVVVPVTGEKEVVEEESKE